MKILHTADWHLGKRLEKFSRLEEQRLVLAEIIAIADQQEVDVILIAGDLFDAYNPSSEAVELFYDTLKKLTANGTRPVIAIAGNHDSPDRIEAPDPLARACGILFAGYPNSHTAIGTFGTSLQLLKTEPGFVEIKLPQYPYPLRLLLTPYANEYRLKAFLGTENGEEELRLLLQQQWQVLADRYADDKGVNILMAHLFMIKRGEQPPEEPDDEKPILHVGGAQTIYTDNVPAQMQYVALGHLHRYNAIDQQPCPAIYSSSPLSYSFAEAGQQKYVIIIDVEPGQKARYTPIKLEQGKILHRKRFEGVDEAVQWLEANPDTLVELTLVTATYMTASDRKRLQQAHEGIVTIIPEVKNVEVAANQKESIDLSQDIETLFTQFFQHKYAQQPNAELIELFKEVRAEQHEE